MKAIICDMCGKTIAINAANRIIACGFKAVVWGEETDEVRYKGNGDTLISSEVCTECLEKVKKFVEFKR